MGCLKIFLVKGKKQGREHSTPPYGEGVNLQLQSRPKRLEEGRSRILVPLRGVDPNLS